MRHAQKQGFYVLDRDPTEDERTRYYPIVRIEPSKGAYNAQRTALDLPISKAVIAAVQTTVDYPVIVSPTSGASLPVIIIEEVLRRPIVAVPLANYDNNQHAANENLKLQFLWDGLETIAALMMMEAPER